MSAKADRLARQADIAAEFDADMHQRPNVSPRQLTDQERCQANLGKSHDYSMKGSDGVRRCWFCCQKQKVTP